MMQPIYFEMNDWWADIDYPKVEPYATWMDDMKLHTYFLNDDWVKENKLCVVSHTIDCATNFLVTTTVEWVQKNCPDLLTTYKKYLVYPGKDGTVIGNWGYKFLSYKEENFGVHLIYD